MKTFNDVITNGGGITPPCIGLNVDALPEVQKSDLTENSQTGVYTRNVPSSNAPSLEKRKTHRCATHNIRMRKESIKLFNQQ